MPKVTLDTTASENTFDTVGQSMLQLARAQDQTNRQLQQHLQQGQLNMQAHTEALQQLTTSTYQCNFDNIFASIPIYDGSDWEGFFPWLECLEAACFYSGRNIKTEALGISGGPVQNVIMALPNARSWKAIREELKRCFSDQTSLGHAAAQLENMTQKPNEALRLYIFRYSKIHKSVTKRDACYNTDPSRWFRFLTSITNTTIADKIIWSEFLPQNLQQCFEKALRLEASLQLSEGVNMAHKRTVMNVEVDTDDEVNLIKDVRARSNACYKCGEVGHFQQDCKYDGDKPTDGQQEQDGLFDSYDPVVGKWMINLVATTPIMVKAMKSLYAELNRQKDLKRSYRRKYKDLQAMVTTTADPPLTLTWPVVVTSNKVSSSPQVSKAAPKGQGKRIIDKGKGVKPPKKGKKNVVKTTAIATTLANPSANIRSKLQDKAKHTAALIQEIMEELQVIEEESLNDEHDSEATQESDLEQEDSDNYLTDDEQWLFKFQDLPFLADEQKLDSNTDKTKIIPNISETLNQDINHIEEVVIGAEQGTTFPTQIGTSVCHALIDTVDMRSCISEKYYQSLPLTKIQFVQNISVRSATGSNLTPLGLINCSFWVGKSKIQ